MRLLNFVIAGTLDIFDAKCKLRARSNLFFEIARLAARPLASSAES